MQFGPRPFSQRLRQHWRRFARDFLMLDPIPKDSKEPMWRPCGFGILKIVFTTTLLVFTLGFLVLKDLHKMFVGVREMSYFPPVSLAAMFIANGASTVVTWTLLIRFRPDVKRWLLFGGVASSVSSSIVFISVGVASFVTIPMLRAVKLSLAVVSSITSGIVIGSAICAAPLMRGGVGFSNMIQTYFPVMMSVSLAASLSFIVLIPCIVPGFDIVISIVVAIALLIVSHDCFKRLPEVRVDRDEICPISTVVTTFRWAHPVSPALCLLVAGYSSGIWIATPWALPELANLTAAVNRTEPGIFKSTADASFSAFASLFFVSAFLPFVPLYIPRVSNYPILYKLLQPIACGITALAFFFIDKLSELPRQILVAGSICRCLLVITAYGDLMWQAYAATLDDHSTPVATGAIATVCGSLGAAAGVMTTTFACPWDGRFPEAALAYLHTVQLVGVVPAVGGLLVLAINIWRCCRPDGCVRAELTDVQRDLLTPYCCSRPCTC